MEHTKSAFFVAAARRNNELWEKSVPQLKAIADHLGLFDGRNWGTSLMGEMKQHVPKTMPPGGVSIGAAAEHPLSSKRLAVRTLPE